jgi:hypothetical protein
MTRPALLLACSVAALALSAAAPAKAAFSVSAGYPRREGTSRIFADATFDATAANSGFNRADCFDTKQTVLLFLQDIPADATTVEIWARRDNTSCADPTQREGTGATTPQCYKVASWLRDEVFNKQVSFRPIQVIQAIDKLTNVTDASALVPSAACAKSSSMPPTQVYLQVMAFNGTNVIGYTSSGGTGTTGGEQILSLSTSYDIAGPNAPTGLSLGAGNELLVAKFSSTAQSTSDFRGYRAYCFPAASKGAGALSTKGADAGLDALDDAVVDDATADGAASDAAADGAAADGASASDAGSGVRAEGCPSGDPFVPGELPGPELDPYICGDDSTTATGQLTISRFGSGEALQNDVPYAVAIGTTDRQGNSGPLSEVVCATPKKTNDFYGVYREAGGTAGGGWCAVGRGTRAASGLAGAVFVLALVGRLARRHAGGRR